MTDGNTRLYVVNIHILMSGCMDWIAAPIIACETLTNRSMAIDKACLIKFLLINGTIKYRS